MQKVFILFLLVFHIPDISFSQVDPSKYSLITLNEKLTKDANAVIRLQKQVIEVISSSKYTTKFHSIVTLLNKEAAPLLNHTFSYNKFRKIENIEIKLYDSTGKLIQQNNKKDFKSVDYDDNVSLFIDEKLLHLETFSRGFPCTVETIYETKTTGYIELPDWYISSPNVSVESSIFTIKVTNGLGIRFRESKTDIKPTIEENGNYKVYNWIATDISATVPEKNNYEEGFNYPKIEITPLLFEYDGYKGDFTSWQSFGAWNYQFYEETDGDIKNKKNEILLLVANCKTEKEKVRILYSYLQKRMRYVSIQLGIGGFKPFPFQYVEDNKYGDCKALTNYMRNLLRLVGIRSYPALVSAGYKKVPIVVDFPSDPFNHVILFVPLDKDSVWLECTSNSQEFGILGAFTENRKALLLTEKGGVLISTPKSTRDLNILSTKTLIYLNEDGSSKTKSNIYCRGDFLSLFYEILKQNKEHQKTIFINYLNFKTPETFQLDNQQDSADGKLFILNLTYDQQYEFKTPSKYFYSLRINKIFSEEIKPTANRRFDYLLDFPYTKTDTTTFILPAENYVESLPDKKIIDNEYANYKREFFKNESGNIITSIGQFSLKKNIIPFKSYADVMASFQQVLQNENEKLIFKRNN